MIWFHDYFFNLQDLPWPLLTRNGFGKPEIPIVLITVEGNLKINYSWFCLFLTKNFYLKKHFHRLLTGLPQLASHYSGIAISATVAVDAVSPTKIQLRYVLKYVNKYLLSWKNIFDIIDFTNFFLSVFSLETPRYANVDGILENRLSGIDGANWREVSLLKNYFHGFL